MVAGSRNWFVRRCPEPDVISIAGHPKLEAVARTSSPFRLRGPENRDTRGLLPHLVELSRRQHIEVRLPELPTSRLRNPRARRGKRTNPLRQSSDAAHRSEFRCNVFCRRVPTVASGLLSQREGVHRRLTENGHRVYVSGPPRQYQE